MVASFNRNIGLRLTLGFDSWSNRNHQTDLTRLAMQAWPATELKQWSPVLLAGIQPVSKHTQ